MEKLPSKYMKLINQYKPVEVEGFTLYPITVEHYEEYSIASQAIGFMQQSLPLEYISMPLLSAFFKLDLEKAIKGEEPTGLYTSALIALVVAMRLSKDDEDEIEVCRKFIPITAQDDHTKLKSLAFVPDLETGDVQFTIKPTQFAKIRSVIAAQNGIEIPDELDNPELVQAEQDLAEKKAPKLNSDVSEMISACAALTGKDEEEIYGWAILKLTRRMKSFRRILDYMVCGIAEGSGSTWKGGNPVPHPFFERIKEGSDALIDMSKFAGGQGMQAMRDAGAI